MTEKHPTNQDILEAFNAHVKEDNARFDGLFAIIGDTAGCEVNTSVEDIIWF